MLSLGTVKLEASAASNFRGSAPVKVPMGHYACSWNVAARGASGALGDRAFYAQRVEQGHQESRLDTWTCVNAKCKFPHNPSEDDRCNLCQTARPRKRAQRARRKPAR